jgi:hypothetical protein
MEKIIENLMSKEIALDHKELLPKGKRKIMLYLGEKVTFKEDFEHMSELYRETIKFQRNLEKVKEKMRKNEDEFDTTADSEWIFL